MIYKKNIKKLIKTILLSSIIFSTTNVFANNFIIKIDNQFANFNEPIEIVDNFTMVNVNELHKKINATIIYNDFGNTAVLKKGDNQISVNSGSIESIANGEKINLDIAPKKINGYLYVPLRNVVEKLGVEVLWDNTTKSINLVTGDIKEDEILNLNTSITEKTEVLTYEKGLELAHKQSSSLKTIDESKKLVEKSIEDAKDLKNASELMGDQSGVIKAERLLKSLRNQNDNFFENTIILKDSIELSYRNAIKTIQDNEFDLRLLKETIELDKLNVKNIQLKHDLGMESDINLKKAKEKLTQSEGQIDILNKILQTEKNNLNNIIGRSPNEDIYIDFKPEMKSVSSNITNHVNFKIEKDPQLVILKRNLEEKVYIEDSSIKDLNDSEITMENDITNARREYNDTISNYTKNMYNNYNNLRQLEGQKNILETDLLLAKTDYDTAVTNYEVGNITIYDVQRVKTAVIKVEIDLEKLKFNYDSLVFLYDRPYLSK